MKNNTIESVHANLGAFNGFLYFTLNNRLLILSVSTPSFNDFYEWRITEITYASKEYKPEENTVELIPLKDFNSITLTDKEVEYIELHFSDKELQEEELDLKIKEFNTRYPDAVNLWDYTGDILLASINFKDKVGLSHSLYKTNSNNTEKQKLCEEEYGFIQTSEWENKKDITVEQGMYNILIPIMDSFVENCKS